MLQYAPSPSQAQLGSRYGRQPSMCGDEVPPQGQGAMCHAPHLYEEWWVGPASGRAVDVAGWRRPYRRTHAAPHDAFLMAPPVPFNDRLLWLGSTGSVYSLPMFRIAGIYAPANGEFNTGVFTYPAAGVFVNAEATWKGETATGGCDEGCNAYIFGELLDANTGQPIVGHTRAESLPMMNVSGTKLPLRWRTVTSAGAGLVEPQTRSNKPPPCAPGTTGCPLVGAAVQLRLFFRDATIFAVGSL